MAVVRGGPRLVILRALGLGDLLTAVPALRAVARGFGDHHRTLLAPRALAPLVELLGKTVHQVVDVDYRGRVGGELPAVCRGAEVAVNLHGRGPQSHAALLATRPERLVAFAHPDVPASADGPVWIADEHERHRWCRLLMAFGVHADPEEFELAVDPAPDAEGATVLHPGAAAPARRWPVERWAAVAGSEHRAGRRVLLTGNRTEAPLARRIATLAGLPACSVLAGRTDLRPLARVVAGSARVVCGDTGVAHLATATGTPSVVLFGPTSPAHWGPPARHGCHIALWAGRTGDPYADQIDPGLLAITVDDVLTAMERLPPLNRSAGSGHDSAARANS